MIRPLELSELAEVTNTGELCYRELAFPCAFDPIHFYNVWKSFYESKVGIILTKEENGVYKGFIGGIIYIDPFDRTLKCQEFGWYIKPQYRSPQLASELLHAFENWSQSQGAKYLKVAAPSAKTPLGSLLRKVGYREIETIFEKEL